MQQKAANCKMFKYHVYSFSKPNKVVLIKTDFQKKKSNYIQSDTAWL